MASGTKIKKWANQRNGKRDFYTRVDEDLAIRLEAVVSKMEPATAISPVIAMLIKQFVEKSEVRK